MSDKIVQQFETQTTFPHKLLNPSLCVRKFHGLDLCTPELRKKIKEQFTVPFELVPNDKYDQTNPYHASNITYVKRGTKTPAGVTPKDNVYTLCPCCDPCTHGGISNIQAHGPNLEDASIPMFYERNYGDYEVHLAEEHGIFKNGSVAQIPFVGFCTPTEQMVCEASIICPYSVEKCKERNPCLSIFKFDPKSDNPYREYFQHIFNHHNLKKPANIENIITYQKDFFTEDHKLFENIFYPFSWNNYETSLKFLRYSCNDISLEPFSVSKDYHKRKYVESFTLSSDDYLLKDSTDVFEIKDSGASNKTHNHPEHRSTLTDENQEKDSSILINGSFNDFPSSSSSSSSLLVHGFSKSPSPSRFTSQSSGSSENGSFVSRQSFTERSTQSVLEREAINEFESLSQISESDVDSSDEDNRESFLDIYNEAYGPFATYDDFERRWINFLSTGLMDLRTPPLSFAVHVYGGTETIENIVKKLQESEDQVRAEFEEAYQQREDNKRKARERAAQRKEEQRKKIAAKNKEIEELHDWFQQVFNYYGVYPQKFREKLCKWFVKNLFNTYPHLITSSYTLRVRKTKVNWRRIDEPLPARPPTFTPQPMPTLAQIQAVLNSEVNQHGSIYNSESSSDLEDPYDKL